MKNHQTSEMTIYNKMAENYEKLLLGGKKNDALQIARNIHEYLKMLPHNTKMYGDGKRWITSSTLIEYNNARINRLERECYSVEIGGAHNRNDK